MTTVEKYVDSPTERSLKLLRLEAQQIARSGLVPDAIRKSETSEADIMLVGLTAQALGVTNLATALQHVHVIDGKPAVSAALAIGVAEVHAGVMWMVEESTNERCRVRGRRRDWPSSWPDTVVEFTIDDARRAGLLDEEWVLFRWDSQAKKNKRVDRWDPTGGTPRPEWARTDNRDAKLSRRDPWHRYPAAMCLARATKMLAKALGAAALVGLRARPVDLDLDVEEIVGPDVATAAEVGGRHVVEGPAERDEHERDDDIVDAELVDDTPDVVSEAWRRWWHANPGKGLSDDERHAVVHFTTDGRTSSLADVLNAERDAVKAVTERYTRGELVLTFADDGTPTLSAKAA